MVNIAEQNLKYTISTGAIEKAIPSKNAIKLCESMSQGNITANAAVDLLKKKYGLVDRVKCHG